MDHPKSMMDVALIQNVDPIDIGLGSSEKGTTVVPTKRKKTMTSVYLKFFETAPDGKSRRCKFCGQSYSIATATGRTPMVVPFPLLFSSIAFVNSHAVSSTYLNEILLYPTLKLLT